MKRNKFLKEGSKTSLMLKELNDDLDLFFTFGLKPVKVLKYGIDGVRRSRDVKKRHERRQSLRRLQKQKLVEIRKIAEQYYISLTQEGVAEILRQRIYSADVLPKGLSCIVIFDVPEVEASIRKMIRRFLKSVGFVQIQKSVWVSPYKAAEPLIELFKSVESTRWIRVYYGEQIT